MSTLPFLQLADSRITLPLVNAISFFPLQGISLSWNRNVSAREITLKLSTCQEKGKTGRMPTAKNCENMVMQSCFCFVLYRFFLSAMDDRLNDLFERSLKWSCALQRVQDGEVTIGAKPNSVNGIEARRTRLSQSGKF